jgi:hypothetical protein
VLDELKTLIAKPIVMSSPKLGETLLLYVVATSQVISVALVVEREEPRHVYKVQRLIYYITKSSLIAKPTTIRCKVYFMLF